MKWIRYANELGLSWIVALLLMLPLPVRASDTLPSGREVMQAVERRRVGESRFSRITFRLTDRRGTTRVQRTKAYRKFFGDEKRSVIFYTDPTNVRGTAFLTYDHPDPDVDDDQWLYLPAMGKVRRISASDRGDYFLGTDLTYEDVKNENKLPTSDYHFEAVGRETVDGVACVVVAGTPRSQKLAEELGYGRLKAYVDTGTATIRKGEYWDVTGNRLKTTRFLEVRRVDGIWTVHRIEVDNHKTGHRTVLIRTEVDYERHLDDRLFTRNALRRGRF